MQTNWQTQRELVQFMCAQIKNFTHDGVKDSLLCVIYQKLNDFMEFGMALKYITKNVWQYRIFKS